MYPKICVFNTFVDMADCSFMEFLFLVVPLSVSVFPRSVQNRIFLLWFPFNLLNMFALVFDCIIVLVDT